MALAEVIKSLNKKQQKEIGYRLFEYAKKRGKRVKEPMKSGDYFRASSLPYLCPREEVLASKYDIIRGDDNPPDLQITFDIGHLFHYLYRNIYFGPMGEWVGAWECVKCGWNTDKAGLSSAPVPGRDKGKLAKMPSKCLGCGAEGAILTGADNAESNIVFMEWELFDDRLMLKGHVDGWFKLSGYNRILCDLKSSSSNRFSTIKNAQSKHEVQVWAYMWMCGDTHGVLRYLNKSPWGDHTNFIREPMVSYSVSNFDEHIRKPLEALQNGLSGGAYPDRLCVSDNCPRAKNCQLSEVCFSV